MRPTGVQNTIPHPLCIDYMPWPDFRDYLCLHQNQDRRHSVSLYLKSIQLLWPGGHELLSQHSDGYLVLNGIFEGVVSDIGNWRMGSPWTDTFPDLLKYVGG